jgi:F420H(2)-dependent quinone reductase
VRAISFGKNDNMPVRSFYDANAFHRTMRRFAATKVGVTLFRPTLHHLDKLVTKLSGGRLSFVGIAAGVPAVILTTTGAKSGEPRTVAVFGIPHPDGLGLRIQLWRSQASGLVPQPQGQPRGHGIDQR